MSATAVSNGWNPGLEQKETNAAASFEALVLPLKEDIYRFLCWLGSDPMEAEDITQEVLLRAWRSLPKLRSRSSIKAWLLTIARRERTRFSSRKKLPTVPIDDCHSDPALAVTAEPSGSSELTDLRHAIARLPQSTREPLLLQVLFGMSVSEIASTLDLTPSAVMGRVFRARERLIREQGRED